MKLVIEVDTDTGHVTITDMANAMAFRPMRAVRCELRLEKPAFHANPRNGLPSVVGYQSPLFRLEAVGESEWTCTDMIPAPDAPTNRAQALDPQPVG